MPPRTVANGVNTVHCSYSTTGGHALIGARIYVPAEQLDDPDRRTGMGIPAEVVFKTKPQLAIDIIAENVMPPWCAGDEGYRRSSELRTTPGGPSGRLRAARGCGSTRYERVFT
jgi:hypothetical protein